MMTGLWIAIAFILWYGLSLYLSEHFAYRWPGRQGLFFISFIFSPLLAFLVVFLTERTKKHEK